MLVLFNDHTEAEYEIDAPRAITNLLELVPIKPEAHEDTILAAATFLNEYQMTPFVSIAVSTIVPLKRSARLQNVIGWSCGRLASKSVCSGVVSRLESGIELQSALEQKMVARLCQRVQRPVRGREQHGPVRNRR